MSLMASQITSLTIVYSTVYSGTDQRKHQSSASLAFVRGIHWGPVNSTHKWPVTRKMFPFDDVIMEEENDGGHRIKRVLYIGIERLCIILPIGAAILHFSGIHAESIIYNNIFGVFVLLCFDKIITIIIILNHIMINIIIGKAFSWHDVTMCCGTSMACLLLWDCVWHKMNHFRTIAVQSHDDVTKGKHFPRCWPSVRGIHRSPVNFPHKGQ